MTTGVDTGILTTGQVAKLCKVAPRTVSKWFDSGRLQGYRLPGSKDRRVPVSYLKRFLRENGMDPLDVEDSCVGKILVVTRDESLPDDVKRHLPPKAFCKLITAGTMFDAGAQAAWARPDIVVIDFGIGRAGAIELCRALRRNGSFQGIILVAVAADGDNGKSPDLESIAPLIDELFLRPLDTALLAEHVWTLVAAKKDLEFQTPAN